MLAGWLDPTARQLLWVAVDHLVPNTSVQAQALHKGRAIISFASTWSHWDVAQPLTCCTRAGENNYCLKVQNCQAAGGKAAIIYVGRQQASSCLLLLGRQVAT